MVSTVKVTNIDTPDNTGNVTFDRPIVGDGSGLTSLPAANLTGTVATARLGTGTANSTTFLRGDQTYAAAGGGLVKGFTYVQTRTQATYTCPISGDGTEIAELTITVTPSSAGNKMVLEWHVNGEMGSNAVYVVSRDGTLLTDTTDGSNNQYAGTVAQPYDADNSSTPDNAIVRIVDTSTLATSSVYRLLVRSSATGTQTFYLNRTVGSTGGTNNETSLSTGTATEYE